MYFSNNSWSNGPAVSCWLEGDLWIFHCPVVVCAPTLQCCVYVWKRRHIWSKDAWIMAVVPVGKTWLGADFASFLVKSRSVKQVPLWGSKLLIYCAVLLNIKCKVTCLFWKRCAESAHLNRISSHFNHKFLHILKSVVKLSKQLSRRDALSRSFLCLTLRKHWASRDKAAVNGRPHTVTPPHHSGLHLDIFEPVKNIFLVGLAT